MPKLPTCIIRQLCLWNVDIYYFGENVIFFSSHGCAHHVQNMMMTHVGDSSPQWSTSFLPLHHNE